MTVHSRSEAVEPHTQADHVQRALDRKIMRGSTWVAFSYGGRQLTNLLSMLVLVRLVEPKAFGLIALAWTALYVLQTVQESGMSAALVHRREDIERAAASVLLFAAAGGLVVYAVAFEAAPVVAGLFHAPALVSVLRVMALLVPIQALGTVPAALFEREVNFRPRTVSDLAAALTQAAVAIALALAGADVWALVGGQVCAAAVSTALLWVLVPHRPSPRLASWRLLRELVGYGRFVTASNLLLIAGGSIDNVVVGRLLGTTLLGFYAVAYRLCSLPVLVIGTIVGRVMFPIYAAVREDVATTRRAFVQNLQRVALLTLPVSVGMAAGATPLVRTLLGEEWLRSVAPLRVLAVFAVIRALAGPVAELFKGMGKPQYNLVLGVVFLATATGSLVLLVPAAGLAGAAASIVVAAVVTNCITFTLAFRLVRLSPRELGRELRPFLVSALLVGGAVGLTSALTRGMPAPASLAAAIAVGAAVYVASTALLARSVVGPMWVALRESRRPGDMAPAA